VACKSQIVVAWFDLFALSLPTHGTKTNCFPSLSAPWGLQKLPWDPFQAEAPPDPFQAVTGMKL